MRLIIALLLLGLESAAFAFQENPNSDWEEEVYLSFRYQGVIDEIVVAIAKNDEFYLPVAALFDLFAINYNLNPTRFSLSGYYLIESNEYTLDFSGFTASIGGDHYELTASEFLIKDLDYFVKPEVLNRIFGLDLQIDLSRLVLRLKTKNTLPIVTRYENRRSHERRMEYTQTTDEWYPLIYDRNRTTLNGGLFDYSLYSTVSQQTSYMNLNTTIGGELLFGDIRGKIYTASNAYGTSINATGFRWRYVQDISPWFTRLNIGEISSKGMSPRSMQGVSVSNEPLLTRTSFDQYIIDGNTEPEAEIELYQDNRLVEVMKADDDGYYRFYVPLNYGISRFKIRIYAKQGHIIELDRQIDIPFSFLPPGEFRYQAYAGVKVDDDPLDTEKHYISQTAFSYGLNSWLSVKTGVDYFQNENDDAPIVYNQVSARVGGTIMMNIDLAYDQLYKINTYGRMSSASSWNVDYVHFVKDGSLNQLGLKQALNAGTYFPVSMIGPQLIVRLDGSWQDYPDRNVLRYNMYLNNTIKGIRFRYGLADEHIFTPATHAISSRVNFGAVYSIPRNPVYHDLLQGTYLRSDLKYNTGLGQMETFEFQLTKRFTKRFRLQFVYANDFLRENQGIELGVLWDAEKFRSTSSIKSGQQSVSLVQTFRGSSAYDRPNGKLLWDNRQQVGSAGASIRMYIDENNSGAFEESEEIIPGNAVSIKRVTTRQITQGGITRLTQLQPYRRYNLFVNEAKISNPLLLAKNKEFSVILDPNSYKVLNIPFYTTGIIEGHVDKIVDQEYVAISGLRIHVRNDDGSYETVLRTFVDGSFYSMELPPGEYEAWVDDTQLEFLGMISIPERLLFSVEAKPDGDFIDGLNFILQ